MRKLLALPLLFLASLSFGASKYQTDYLTVTGSATIQGDISAEAYYGDGSNLTGVHERSAGSEDEVQVANSTGGFKSHTTFTFTDINVDGSPYASALVKNRSTTDEVSIFNSYPYGLYKLSGIAWKNPSSDLAGMIGLGSEGLGALTNRMLYWSNTSGHDFDSYIVSAGSVAATSFYGDGSNLTGISSGGSQIYPATATPSFPYGATTSSFTVQDANSNFSLYLGTLPVNSGFGPQVVTDGIWNKTNNSGDTLGSFNIVVSTTNRMVSGGGAPVIPAPGGALSFTSSGVSFSTYGASNRFGSTAWGVDSTGFFIPSLANKSVIGTDSSGYLVEGSAGISYSSASVSYLGKSSSTITELSKSSASVSYLGISSSPALSPTAMTYSSASVTYLHKSSATAGSSYNYSRTIVSTAPAVFQSSVTLGQPLISTNTFNFISSGTFSSFGATNATSTFVNTSTGVIGGVLYFGSQFTDGAWRARVQGTVLRFERRESGSWVLKGGFDQ